MWDAIDRVILFLWDLHPYYSLGGLVVLLIFLAVGYFKFRIRVPEGNWVYYSPEKSPLRGPGAFFMPYEHTLVSGVPKTFFVGLNELLVTSQVEVTERGERNQWQRTVNSNRDASADKFIVTWQPHPDRLGDFLKRPQPATEDIEEVLRNAVRADPEIDLQKLADMNHLGIIVTVQRPAARKKTVGSVMLAQNVEIPYEG